MTASFTTLTLPSGDAVLRWSVYPDTYNPMYFSDSIHPNLFGHTAMADAVPDPWFNSHSSGS